MTGFWGRWFAAFLLVLFSAVGCKEGGPDGGSFEVGPEGGRAQIALPGGAIEIEVPPGALDKPVRLTAALAPNAAVGHVGPVYELGPNGTQFSKPVALRVVWPESLPIGIRGSPLSFVTEKEGAWSRLPTSYLADNRIEGLTTHFSNFSLGVPCHDAGTGTSFALNDCPTFNPRIVSSAPVTLDASASVLTLVMHFIGSGAGTMDLTVSGLVPGHTYTKYVDSYRAKAAVAADAAGVARFTQDVSTDHLVLFQVNPASIVLTSAACVAQMASWDATTHTCTLLQDVADSFSIEEAGLTLDCKDPTTGVRHKIGSLALRKSVGVFIPASAPNAGVRSCDIQNVDFGVMAMASGLRLESVGAVVSATELHAGTGAFEIWGTGATVSDVSADNYSVGIGSSSAGGLVVRRASLRATGMAVLFEGGAQETFEDVSVDGSLVPTSSSGLPTAPNGAIWVASVRDITFRRLTMTNLAGFGAGIFVQPTAIAVAIEGANISSAPVGISLTGPVGVVSGSTLSGNAVGLRVARTDQRIFHNNIHGNSGVQVAALNAIELSDVLATSPTYKQGNYWGHVCPDLFKAGLDSDRPDTVDSYPYDSANGWATGGLPGCPPPTPNIIAPKDWDYLNQALPHIAGTAAPNADVEVKANGKSIGTGKATALGGFDVVPMAPLADGQYALTAVASLNGRVSSPSPSILVTIDTLPPPAPILLTPSQGIRTTEASIAVSGQAEAQSVVTVFDGPTKVGEVIASANGSFSFIPATPFSIGPHTLVAFARDRAGNVSPPSAALSLTVISVSVATPLLGVRGRISVTSLEDAPDPFELESLPPNTLTAKAYVNLEDDEDDDADEHHAEHQGSDHVADHHDDETDDDEPSLVVRREIIDPRTQSVVAVDVSKTPIPKVAPRILVPRVLLPRGVAVTGQSAWAGLTQTGALVQPGVYVSNVQVGVSQPAPAGPVAPGRCLGTSAVPAVAGLCWIDVTPVFQGTVTVLPSFNDPFLSLGQRQLLSSLQKSSSEPIRMESWPRAGTVSRLGLFVRSGLSPTSPMEAHARAFVGRYLALWKLSSIGQLRVVAVQQAGDCSSVSYQLIHPSGLPVFGAVLAVRLSPDGAVREVVARMTGEYFSFGAPQAIGPAAAATILKADLASPGIGLPQPAEVIVDPYFVRDGEHAPSRGWLFQAPPGTVGVAGPYAVDQSLRAVSVHGPAVGVLWPGAPSCPGVASFPGIPDVVLDPLTRTPAYIGLGHFGGIGTTGLNAVDRAYRFLSSSFMVSMYGDRSPIRHLRQPTVLDGPRGRTLVRFHEYYAGMPVEGAAVTVVLGPNSGVEAVLGRFVYFPVVATIPAVSFASIDSLAFGAYLDLECGADALCRNKLTLEQSLAKTPTSLVVLSSKIFKGTALSPFEDRLAWKIEYPRRNIYWDATGVGGLLFHVPKSMTHLPYRVRNISANDRIEIVDGLLRSGIVPDPESINVANLMPALNEFYMGLGQHGYDNSEGGVELHVRAGPIGNAMWCLHFQGVGCDFSGIHFGDGFAVGDVLGHEYTHGVTQFSADLIYAGEPGALNESYSDVMGELAFPDSNPAEWLIGEGLPNGALRDLRNPAAHNQPGTVSAMPVGCLRPDELCVHNWSGVPSRAAVLIADGGVAGSSRPGLGRPTLARLYHQTLTRGLGSSDGFINQRLATEEMCRAMVGESVGGRLVVPADCDHVGSAFDAVEVTVQHLAGWYQFSTGLLGGGFDVSQWTGMRLFQGCAISDLRIIGVDPGSNSSAVSNIAGGLSISLDGEWGAYVTFRGSATGATDRSVKFHVWSTWYDSGMVSLLETYSVPAGLMPGQCLQPGPGRHSRTLYSAARVEHWATVLDGGTGDDVLSPAVLMPFGCEVISVLGVHYHSGAVYGSVASSLDDGSHGFTVTRFSPSPSGLGANVHWWHNGTSGILVRVVYQIVENDEVDCSVAGATQDLP